MQRIQQCQHCVLHQNQAPLLDQWKKSEVCFIGLSAKLKQVAEETPLDKQTKTGEIIHQIEKQLAPYMIYKTNLVKCVPLNENQKLRYPTTDEMKVCVTHLTLEFEAIQPKVVFLLGKKVEGIVANKYDLKFKTHDTLQVPVAIHKGMFFVSVYHPSYIYVYKRKQIDAYVEQLTTISRTLLNEN